MAKIILIIYKLKQVQIRAHFFKKRNQILHLEEPRDKEMRCETFRTTPILGATWLCWRGKQGQKENLKSPQVPGRQWKSQGGALV